MDVLTGVLTHIALAIVFGGVFIAARKRAVIYVGREGCMLEYPAIMKAIPILTSLLMLGLFSSIYLPIFKTPPNPREIIGVVVGGMILVAVLLLEFRTRVHLTNEAITYYSSWGKIRTIRWDEVREVTYSVNWNQFEIHPVSGKKMVIHTMFQGMVTFFEVLRRNLPPEKLSRAESGFRIVTKRQM